MAKAKVKVKVKKTNASQGEPSNPERKLPKQANRRVIVSLPGGPQILCRDVANNEEAWEMYKKIAGINGTDHMPSFRLPGEDDHVNEHGVIVDPTTGVAVLGSEGANRNWDADLDDDEFDDEE